MLITQWSPIEEKTADPKSPAGSVNEVATMSSITNGARESKAPSDATDAVLKPSEPVPDGARQVQGIDFDNYADRSITVDELVAGMASMGFQATSVGEAVRIIEGMVGQDFPP